ncbi:MAG: hypothetical protein H8D96_11330 [Desulfobacterales bacterium]|uniref:SHOCT domain-containing protein n=1 Tax=Candidatus Desulfatibia vada TaxID=2841696 RepID=A0A8J6TKU2_9BACT|nr:hypothetical protein [Candidatus Desulfatibia vada]
MAFNKTSEENKHFKSVLMAYFILVLHVLLIAGLVMLVIFFRGIINYMLWIFIGGAAIILASGYHFYKRLQKDGKTLGEMMSSSRLGSSPIEISFLGGIASFKIGRPGSTPALSSEAARQPLQQLEDPATVRVRELTELVRMLEDNLITLDEYNKVKQQILKP